MSPCATSINTGSEVSDVNVILAETYPEARCELDFRTPFELLVATVLSAQTTDVRVNSVTPRLFSRFPTPQHLATAEITEVEEIIRPVGLYRNKAANLVGLSEGIVDKHHGEVPENLKELTALPGVGRKTALVVLGNAFDVPSFAVDTHVARLCRRLGLTSNENPLKVEKDITASLPASQWTDFSHRLIFHGRQVCHARKPLCGQCVLADDCPSRQEEL